MIFTEEKRAHLCFKVPTIPISLGVAVIMQLLVRFVVDLQYILFQSEDIMMHTCAFIVFVIHNWSAHTRCKMSPKN